MRRLKFSLASPLFRRAWSSIRDPQAVFTLLETLYHGFDQIAKRRRVYKVETIGDCYVAVVGLPDPRKDHATVMCRFAHECLGSMLGQIQKLSVKLGPDTCDLGMRFGIHSGPVTAGVLRGEKARFQLFGDTVNTTARIETSGKRNKIHISADTAVSKAICIFFLSSTPAFFDSYVFFISLFFYRSA
jgi:class 3 adenylate cyclase